MMREAYHHHHIRPHCAETGRLVVVDNERRIHIHTAQVGWVLKLSGASAAVAVGVSAVARCAAVCVLTLRVCLARDCVGVFTDDPPTLPLLGCMILSSV